MNNLLTIDLLLARQESYNFRYKLYVQKKSPFIYIRDSLAGQRVRINCKPHRTDNPVDLAKIWERIQFVGHDDWFTTCQAPIKHSYWKDIAPTIKDFITNRCKGSARSNPIGHLNKLMKQEVGMDWVEIRKWLYEVDPKQSSGFINRCDSLELFRKALTQNGEDDPDWLDKDLLAKERRVYHSHRNMKYKEHLEDANIRAITNKELAEEWLDQYKREYPFETWCVAMMVCYGLRNHELWYVYHQSDGFITVPGALTKSIKDHIVWPVFPSWLEKYRLIARMDGMKKELWKRCKPVIKDIENRTELKELLNNEDRGIGDNNQILGAYFTNQIYGKVPNPLIGRVPTGSGKMSRRLLNLNPYDMRHSYAVIMHSEEAWSHIDEAKVAKAMGHSLTVHQKHYLKWIDKEKMRDSFIKNFQAAAL